MKKLIVLISVILISYCSYGQRHITSGMSGANVRAYLNANFDSLYKLNWYNGTRYGMVGDGVTDNTSAFQALIDRIALLNGTIYLPSGNYLINAVTLTHNVKLQGDVGTYISASTLGSTMITIDNAGFNPVLISDVIINGDHKANVGIYCDLGARFKILRTQVQYTNTIGIHLRGMIIGSIEDSPIINNLIGIKATRHAEDGGVTNNAVSIEKCMIRQNTKTGIWWESGALVNISNCAIEQNGAVNDSTTGGIYYTDTEGSIGLNLYGNWFEANHGICVFIDDANSIFTHNHNFVGNSFQYNLNETTSCDLKVVGITKEHYVNLIGNTFEDVSFGRFYGSKTYVTNINSHVVGTIKKGYSYNYLNPITINGHLSPQSTTSPTDTVYSRGWGIMYKEGIEYKVKLYR